MTSLIPIGRKEGHFLFNDALNTFYLRLYGVRHMVKPRGMSVSISLLAMARAVLAPVAAVSLPIIPTWAGGTQM